MPKKKRRGKKLFKLVNSIDRRKNKEQQIIWNVDAPTDFYKNCRSKKHERRIDVDTRTTITQLLNMCNNREIDGVITVAFGRKGELYLIAAGEPFRDPIRGSGAITRLKTLFDHYPEHPVIKG